MSPLLGRTIDAHLTTPNTAMIGLGDMADFGIKRHMEVRFLQAMPPPRQPYMIKDIFEELTIPERNPRKKKILLADCIGNHTYEAFQQAGLFFEAYFDDLELPMLPGVGQIFVEYGDQEYEIGVAHRYWGNSRLNKCLGPKRLAEFLFPNCRISAVAHQHWKNGEWMIRAGRRVDLLRPGHWRSEMQLFEKQRGYYESGHEGGVAILIHPDKDMVEQFDNIEAGMARLADLCELDDYRKERYA